MMLGTTNIKSMTDDDDDDDWIFSTDFFKNNDMLNFIKIRPLGTSCPYGQTDGRTDIYTDMTNLIVALSNFANTPIAMMMWNETDGPCLSTELRQVFLKRVPVNKHYPSYTFIIFFGLIDTVLVRTEPSRPTSWSASPGISLFQHLKQNLISCWFSSCSIFISQVRDLRPFIYLFIGRPFSSVMQLVKETDPVTLQNTRKYVAVRCLCRACGREIWRLHDCKQYSILGSDTVQSGLNLRPFRKGLLFPAVPVLTLLFPRGLLWRR